MSFVRSRSPLPTARLSRLAIVTLLVALIGFTPAALVAQGSPVRTFNVVPITITGVHVQNGGLVATGVVGGNTFVTDLLVSATPSSTTGACPILNLELQAIHIDLLGLNIDTSDICLDVTANAGQGLLGDLLCRIANLLSNNSLADILNPVNAHLSESDFARLNAGLTSLLNQAVFIPISSSPALQNATCNVLSLALGPLELNLLGLHVELDDCEGGPVTLDITADPGGGLLGKLLCSLAGQPAQSIPALRLLRAIAQLIGVLVA